MRTLLLATLLCIISPIAYADDEVPDTYQTLKPLFDSCARCHAASMDLRSFPFTSRYATQEDLVREMLRRFRLTTWQRMPPPNYTPEALPEADIVRIEAWLDAGLPAE